MFRLLSTAFLLLLTQQAAALEEVCGYIDYPTTWSKAKSPYHVRGDVYISPSARLTIEAGTTVLIVPGESCGDTRQLDWADSNMVSIKVDGALFITGTADEPVVIQPKNHVPGKIQWDGIRIRNKAPVLVQIEHLHIAGAQKAIRATQSSFHIANSLFADNNTAIWLEEEANLQIYNNVITGSRSSAIGIHESDPYIVANIFYKNHDHAIEADSRPKPRIEYNLFYKNGDLDCWHCPVGIGKLSQLNDRGDSVDRNFNLYKDPIFMGGASDKYLSTRDPSTPTPAKSTKDTALQRLYAQASAGGRAGLAPAAKFNPQGQGEWRLSRYSPALDAAPDEAFFQDANGTRGDIGLYGGKLGRARAKVK